MSRFPIPTLLLLAACGSAVHHEPADTPARSVQSTMELTAPGPIVWEPIVSARWSVPLSGVVDLEHPAASDLEDGPHPIVLPVHLLTHPDAGTWMIDSGVARELPIGGLLGPVLRGFISDLEVVEPLGDILEDRSLSGVVLTHGHLDHVLGLPDVPDGVPILAGPHEGEAHRFEDRFTLPTFKRALSGRPLRTLPFESAGPTPWSAGLPAIDLLGDGSLWALHVPGHTPGSTALLARTTEGPVLFTGDCSHTRWGWDHGVPPGTYTVDAASNQDSLDALKQLARGIDGIEVVVGHEL